MFVTDAQIAAIAEDMQSLFEIGTLHSRSSIKQIASHAQEELADRGLPTRPSLCGAVAKVALMNWQSTIHQTKQVLT